MGEAPGAQAFKAFFDAMADLYLHAGRPSYRSIAQGHRGISHPTVPKVINGPRLPRWDHVKIVVHALHGDQAHFKALWNAAARASVEKPPLRQDEPGEPGGIPTPQASAPPPDPPPDPPPYQSRPAGARAQLPSGADASGGNGALVPRASAAWDFGPDPTSMPDILRLMRAADEVGADVGKIVYAVASENPKLAAPAITFIAQHRGVEAAASIVAEASQTIGNVAALLSDLPPKPLNLHGFTGTRAQAEQLKNRQLIASQVCAAVLTRLLDVHRLDPTSLVEAVVPLCRPPQRAYRSLARRILTASIDQDHAEEVAIMLRTIDDIPATTVALETMFQNHDSRAQAGQALGWLAVKADTMAVAVFLNLIYSNERLALRRQTDGVSILALIARSYRQWPALLGAAVAANSEQQRPITRTELLSRVLQELGQHTDEIHHAVQIVKVLTRAPNYTMSVLAHLANDDLELAAVLLLEAAAADVDRAAQVLSAWIIARFPQISVLSGRIVWCMVEVDPAGTLTLLERTLAASGSISDPRLTGLDRDEIHYLNAVLDSHATARAHREAIRAMLPKGWW
ncbi:hypothetical protein ACFPIJ_35775 [Dactylosporangium cerinum]|uniref:Uncharacterized protein n=1 Tax=Dactylosporangium cerinum TaxID=1434730 RepID=A0ABV9W3D1_9ACTN